MNEGKKDKVKREKYAMWFFFNIIVPLTPVLLKLFITIVGKKESFSVDILDSSELIYYNFIICTVYIFDTVERNEREIMDVLFGFVAFFVVVIDVVLLVMIYGKTEGGFIVKALAICMSVLIPIVVARRKYREVVM